MLLLINVYNCHIQFFKNVTAFFVVAVDLFSHGFFVVVLLNYFIMKKVKNPAPIQAYTIYPE